MKNKMNLDHDAEALYYLSSSKCTQIHCVQHTIGFPINYFCKWTTESTADDTFHWIG